MDISFLHNVQSQLFWPWEAKMKVEVTWTNFHSTFGVRDHFIMWPFSTSHVPSVQIAIFLKPSRPSPESASVPKWRMAVITRHLPGFLFILYSVYIILQKRYFITIANQGTKARKAFLSGHENQTILAFHFTAFHVLQYGTWERVFTSISVQ